MWRVKLFLVSGFFFFSVCVVRKGDKAQEILESWRYFSDKCVICDSFKITDNTYIFFFCCIYV